jgi:hypothetical protein
MEIKEDHSLRPAQVKFIETPSQQKKLGVVAYIYIPSYAEA